MITRRQAYPMTLSPSSSIIIDLLLLADAAVAEDTTEVRRLARRIEKMAQGSGSRVIAGQARAVELLAAKGTSASELAEAVDRLLAESEREIDDVGTWVDQGATDSDRRSA